MLLPVCCHQAVKSLLRPDDNACWQVATSLPQTCYKLDELNSLVTSCSNNLLSCCTSTTRQQVVGNKLGTTWQNNSIATTCWQACYKLVASTTCWQDVRFLRVCTRNKSVRTNLATSLFQQACYKSAAGLLQVVRFCVCTGHNRTRQHVEGTCLRLTSAS